MKKLLAFLLVAITFAACDTSANHHHTRRTAHVHCYQYTDPTTHLLLYYYIMSGNNGRYYYYSSTTQYTGSFTEVSWQTSTTPPIDINDAENVLSMPDIAVLDDILPADMQENVETQEVAEPEPTEAPAEASPESTPESSPSEAPSESSSPDAGDSGGGTD